MRFVDDLEQVLERQCVMALLIHQCHERQVVTAELVAAVGHGRAQCADLVLQLIDDFMAAPSDSMSYSAAMRSSSISNSACSTRSTYSCAVLGRLTRLSGGFIGCSSTIQIGRCLRE